MVEIIVTHLRSIDQFSDELDVSSIRTMILWDEATQSNSIARVGLYESFVKLLRKTPEYIAQFASLKTILSQALHVVAFFVAPYFTISSPLILCVGNMIGWVARIAAGSRSLGSASIYSVAVAIRLSFMALRRTGKYNDITHRSHREFSFSIPLSWLQQNSINLAISSQNSTLSMISLLFLVDC